MPLIDYHLVGDWSNTPMWHPADVRFLTRDKSWRKLDGLLKNSHFNFSFYFINRPQDFTKIQLDKFGKPLPYFHSELEYLKTNIHDFIGEPVPGLTKIALVHNIKLRHTDVSLTPWMVLHRACHTFQFSRLGDFSQLSTPINKMICTFRRKSECEYDKEFWLMIKEILSLFGKTKSCRSNMLSDYIEFIIESMVWHLIHNNFSYHKLNRDMLDARPTVSAARIMKDTKILNDTVNAFNGQMYQFASNLEKYMQELLKIQNEKGIAISGQFY